MDRVWKVNVTGFVIQKDHMDTPDLWDAFDVHLLDTFTEYPEVEFTELVEVEPMKQCKMCEKYAVPCVPIEPKLRFGVDHYGHNPDITKCELCKK